MATPCAPLTKRPRFSPYFSVPETDAIKILRSAQEIPFPWEQSMPEKISDWFSVVARAHNTLPEFMFVTALSATACVMGPSAFISVRDTYSEPTNMFTVCMGPPGCGKSQAFRLSILDALSDLSSPMSDIMVDDYTRRGLFNHLLTHDGRALCAHEEMSALFDTIQKRQLELSGERQLYCRLYDAGKWTNVTGCLKQDVGKQQQLDKVCLCIAGFLQPLPFIQRLYPSLRECNDGFVDRFLICSPRPKLLLEEEVEEWCGKLKSQRLKSLSKVYSLVTRWHPSGVQRNYTFSDQAKEQYRLFANEMTMLMNSQFDGDGSGIVGNFSKDKRTVIRLSGILHVLFEALNIFIEGTLPEDEIPGVPTMEISQEEIQMAMALTEYFQAQRQAYDKVSDTASIPTSQGSDTSSLAVTIMLTKGAFVTPRNVIKNMTTKKRPHAEEIITEMKALEEQEVGYVKNLTRTQTVFYKPVPAEENREIIVEIIGSDRWDSYTQNFKDIDTMHITASQHNRLLQAAQNQDELELFGILPRSTTTSS